MDKPRQGWESAAALFTEGAREVFGGNLAGVYLHGSAAMGCWNPAKSDLDLIVVVQDSPEDDVRRAFMEKVAALDARMPGADGHSGIEMSVVRREVCDPFVYPTPFELHYSAGHREWYGRDPEDYILKMRGTDRDLAAHFTVIRSRGLCLYGLPVEAVFGEVPAADYLDSIQEDISGAREEIAGNPLYVTLNLARVKAYLAEGRVLSKKEGGEWGLRNLPERFLPLIRTAMEDYEGGGRVQYDPDLAKEYAEYMLSGMNIHG